MVERMKPDDEVLFSGHFIVLHSITVHNVPSAHTNVKADTMERQAKGGRLNFKDLFHMYYFFGERIVFLFQEKKPRSHVRTYRFSPFHCLVPRPQYAFRVTWSEKDFELSPGRSSRVRHRNALTEKAWKDAVQGPGKPVYTYPFLTRDRQALICFAHPSLSGPSTVYL